MTIGPNAAKLPCSAASLLYPSRVARISRFIGKSDITVNQGGWQVNFQGTGADASQFCPCMHFGTFSSSKQIVPSLFCNSAPKRTERHSKWSGVLAVLRWSLASQIMWWTAVFSTVPTAGCPGRSFPFRRAALFADALAGRLLFFGLAGRFSSSRYITGTLVVAILVPFP